MIQMTRSQALARAASFQPRMGRAYAASRNTDFGPDRRENVSALSPHVRRRLILEEELVVFALKAHGPAAAEKFVQEVVWRSYFKGWLERRPDVWSEYRAGLSKDRALLASDPKLARRFEDALSGRSGFACLDAWVNELRETGYLHNHARMWFASIWIFTLGLPWRLGAAFFLQHLLDGDPASNTLSWRWVAGLHTPGKNYAARSSNISEHTNGRFAGTYGLAQNPAPLCGDPNPGTGPLRSASKPDPTRPSLLLITEEDCFPESCLGAEQQVKIVGTATLHLGRLRDSAGVSDRVLDADKQALADAALRMQSGVTELDHPTAEALINAAQTVGASQIVTPFLPIGWVRDWMDDARPTLAAKGITVTEVQRPWDAAFWPLATAGFFKVKKAIPKVLTGLGIDMTPGPEDLPLFSGSPSNRPV